MGLIETKTGGFSVRVVAADLVGSTTLVARTEIVCVAAMVAGAVYNPPPVMVPALGISSQVTEVSRTPVNVALTCVCRLGRNAVAPFGALTEIPTLGRNWM